MCLTCSRSVAPKPHGRPVTAGRRRRARAGFESRSASLGKALTDAGLFYTWMRTLTFPLCAISLYRLHRYSQGHVQGWRRARCVSVYFLKEALEILFTEYTKRKPPSRLLSLSSRHSHDQPKVTPMLSSVQSISEGEA